jgi:hypothetical protein
MTLSAKPCWERRDYVPIGWMEPPTIPSNLLRVLLSDDRWHFGMLTSRMHMAWLTYIGGRLESRYRYGIGMKACWISVRGTEALRSLIFTTRTPCRQICAVPTRGSMTLLIVCISARGSMMIARGWSTYSVSTKH